MAIAAKLADAKLYVGFALGPGLVSSVFGA